MCVTLVYKVWLILPHFDPFGQMWPILLIVTHTYTIILMCYPCLYSVTHFPKSDQYGQMWPIFLIDSYFKVPQI